MADKIQSIRCPYCDEMFEEFAHQEIAFCPVCEETIFTQDYRMNMMDFISDDFNGYTV